MDKLVNKKVVIALFVLFIAALACAIIFGVSLKQANNYIVNNKPSEPEKVVATLVENPEWLQAAISEDEAAEDGTYNPAFMQEAINNALNNHNGGPIGAVIVKDGKIIASTANQNKSQNHSYAHAELCAIKEAEEALDSRNLKGCQLYTSAQPCLMCASAINGSGIDVVYYAATMEDMKNAGFDDDEEYGLMLEGKNFMRSVAVDAPNKLEPLQHKGKGHK